MDTIYADLVHYQVELEHKNEELEEAQHFIDSVLSAMSDVLVVADINGRIQRVNQAMLDMTGKRAEELLERDITILFTGDSVNMVREFPQRVRDHAITDCEAEMLGADGEAVPIAINCSPRYDSNGVLSGMVITGRQLGELRRAYRELQDAHQRLKDAQRQLVQSEKMASLGRLVAGVAHELNNPISFVFGNMHALKRYEGRLLKDIGPLIDGSLEGAERVSTIVQNLRRFATPNHQGQNWFDLSRLVENAVTWVAKTTRTTPELYFDMPEELPVHGSEGHVHQILINLVQNAIDAMEDLPQPRLDIHVIRQPNRVEVHIRDHGPGIPEEHLLHIFDPFFTTKEIGKGTGLGLYISYGLATEQCGGDLSATNHPEGGAEFVLSLPLEHGGTST
ncbi:sensor histidine kinase [endosymbiont of unidentified scaly snail isolate Monju]|uniref:sensor histidine kinase n=1 Tax=endosymbiont of unidentified scaly snail isolate Monju TaxID=1248727 RepID=UPI0003891DE6|nr:ATP-binding protein [endosymbiont of unidentified scaly snail isolate Monju]BAN70053.1 two-component system, NtrC family, sensor histidine-kinase [endosymbiont of unidentified scaly snail isolate Monju]